MSNHKYYNKAKGIIYIQEYDNENLEQFKTDLQENYEVTNVIKASFIKTRTEGTTAFLITFSMAVLPETIYIYTRGESGFSSVSVQNYTFNVLEVSTVRTRSQVL